MATNRAVTAIQEVAALKQALALEKQSNAELAEGIRRQRKVAAQLDAEAAGREHKQKNEIQELKKVCPLHQTPQSTFSSMVARRYSFRGSGGYAGPCILKLLSLLMVASCCRSRSSGRCAHPITS